MGRFFSIILQGSTPVNEKIYDFLWLWSVHDMFPKDTYYDNGELVSKTGISEKLKTDLNRPLSVLGLPLITSLNAYGYLNAKKAVIMTFRNALFDCDNWSKKIGSDLAGSNQKNGRSDMCNFFERVKTDKCPDYAMQYQNLSSAAEKAQFLNNIFNKITGCDYQGDKVNQNPEKIFSMIQKNGNNANNEELYEFIWLSLFSAPSSMNIIYDAENKEFMKNYDSIQNEETKKRVMESDKKQETAYNLILKSIGLPPIVNGRYGYDNAKTGVITAIKMGFFDCESLATVLTGIAEKKDVCGLRDRKFPDTCPVYIAPTNPMEIVVEKKVAQPVPEPVAVAAVKPTPAVAAVSGGIPTLQEMTAKTQAMQAKMNADIAAAMQAASAAKTTPAVAVAATPAVGSGIPTLQEMAAKTQAMQAKMNADIAAIQATPAATTATLDEMIKVQAAQAEANNARIKAEVTAALQAVKKA